MWSRETTARSDDIARVSDSPEKAKVFGFWSGALPFVPKRKIRSLWLPARVVAVPAVSQ